MIKARKLKGDTFSQDDLLEVSYSGSDTLNLLSTIEIISGGAVTHGGGAGAGEYLNYKKDDDLDFSSMEMIVSQEEKGTSIIKVVAKLITGEQEEANKRAYDAWFDRKTVVVLDQDEEFTEEEPPKEETIYKTGEITLEWSDDNYV